MNAQRTVQIIRPSSELSTEDQKIKAAAYCRVSTDSDDQENSFLAQVKYYSDYIGSREDMILVDIYIKIKNFEDYGQWFEVLISVKHHIPMLQKGNSQKDHKILWSFCYSKAVFLNILCIGTQNCLTFFQ